MNWTQTIPTTLGYYWYRPGGDVTRDHIVKVYMEQGIWQDHFYVEVGSPGAHVPIETLQRKGAKDLWAGPIPKPL